MTRKTKKPNTAEVIAKYGPYSIRAAAENEAEILIYGDIGESWWDDESVTAANIVRELQELTVDRIIVRINSYGGAVPDALAIYNALRRHGAEITVAVDGVAVSAASLIAMAGDTVEMADNALMMIHAPWTFAMGNSESMREQADVLDKYAAAMATSYARKTGRSEAEMLALLTDGDDHWFTAAEAKAEKFADEVTDSAGDESADAAGLSRYIARAPARIAAALRFAAPAATRKPKKEPAMPDPTNPAAHADDNKPNVTEIQAAAEKRERARLKERNEKIHARLAPVMDKSGIREIYDAALRDPAVTVDQVAEQALAKLGEGAEPLAGNGARVDAGLDAREKFTLGAASAIAARAGMQKDDGANEYRGYTLQELARASLQMHSVNTSRMDRREIVAQAFTHTSSDFGHLLSNIAEKSMLMGWAEAGETFPQWTRPGTLTDFKVAKRVDLNMFGSLVEIPEGAEYQHGTIGDRGEDIQLATYGRMFSITRQAVINDDLDAFTRIPRRMGRAAIRTVGNLVYAVLTANPAMSDGKTLFHADHNNLLTGASIDTAGVDAMRVAMATQKDPDGHVTALNIPMKFIIVPYALGGAARTTMNSEFEVGASSKSNTTPNTVRGLCTIVEDARLDASSSKAWYGAADPNAFDTVEVAYLDGQQEPYMEQQQGWTVDGVQMKVRIDAAVKALDFRTLAKNPGK